MGSFFIYPKKGAITAQDSAVHQAHFLFPESPTNNQTAQISIASSAFLEPVAPAFLAQTETFAALSSNQEEPRKQTEQYFVEKGDTIAKLAEKFAISQETIFWANNLTGKSVLKEGQELVILPVSGVLHIVKYGETLNQIAQTYKAKIAGIIEQNQLGEEGGIFAGDFLVVPNGIKPKMQSNYAQTALPQSYFIYPLPGPCKISQGLHWFNAVDFNNDRCGDPVFAAAGGTIQRTGYDNVGGNYVRIAHPNGVVTYYGHLSSIATTAGEAVSQGQIIGYVGYTGVTYPKGPDGCHLHFDVRFAKNPFAN